MGDDRRLVSTVGQPSSPVFQRLHERAAARAAELGFRYEWHPQTPDKPAHLPVIGAYAAIVDTEPYDESVLQELSGQTRLLVRFGVGYDSVDVAAASRAGIRVGRTPGGNARAVAEMTLLLMLAARRKLLPQSASVHEGAFASCVTLDLSGSTVGIVGYGAVGRDVHTLLTGFGCEVLVYAPSLSAEDASRRGVESVPLEELARRSDVVTVHLPASDSTRGLISRAIFDAMKPTATFVNTSRGAVVDEAALLDALSSGSIGSAGLDVFTQEPLPADSPLLQAPNLVVTPHAASQTEQALESMFDMALGVVADFADHGTSPHLLEG